MYQILMAILFFLGIHYLPETIPQASAGPFRPRCDISVRGDFDKHLSETRKLLDKKEKCRSQFNEYFNNLLLLAEGYPGVSNKKKFSDFLVWASDTGIISRREAENLYNRYFTPKFLALMGEYNLCSSLCYQRENFENQLEQELGDKERGLLRICSDQEGFLKANQLFSNSIVVVNATCQACVNGQ